MLPLRYGCVEYVFDQLFDDFGYQRRLGVLEQLIAVVRGEGGERLVVVLRRIDRVGETDAYGDRQVVPDGVLVARYGGRRRCVVRDLAFEVQVSAFGNQRQPVWREKRSCSASVSVELSMGATSSALFGKRGMLTVLTSGEMDAPEKE